MIFAVFRFIDCAVRPDESNVQQNLALGHEMWGTIAYDE